MKHLTILALLIATPALAQAPTADQVRDEANGIIAALRSQRDDNADKLAQAMAQNAKLTRDLDKAKSDLKASDEAQDAKDDEQ